MTVSLEIEGHIALVTLNRPESMNALDPESVEQLQTLWKKLSCDHNVRVVVLTGAGDRSFCTGADLKKTQPPKQSFAELHYGSIQSDHDLKNLQTSKPVIAAINGYALGGGLEIALQCDIRIASDQATFGLPEVCIGSIPGAGGTQRLIRSIGQSDAMLMLLTGSRIDAQEALRIGLVSRVVSPDLLIQTAKSIAIQIAANAPLAVSAVKQLALMGREIPIMSGLEMEKQAFGILLNSEDRIEGRTAFKEKRKPHFNGK
jgi:E-phenylitaconyl-CoA hydratase